LAVGIYGLGYAVSVIVPLLATVVLVGLGNLFV
jgi:hypothetical protein